MLFTSADLRIDPNSLTVGQTVTIQAKIIEPHVHPDGFARVQIVSFRNTETGTYCPDIPGSAMVDVRHDQIVSLLPDPFSIGDGVVTEHGQGVVAGLTKDAVMVELYPNTNRRETRLYSHQQVRHLVKL